MTFDFALILVIAVAVCGLLTLLDILFYAPRRLKRIAAYRQRVEKEDPAISEKLKKEPVLIEYGKSFFPILLLVLALRSFMVEPFQIPSGSMRPTLEVGDFILVNKFAYGVRLPVIDKKIIEVGEPQRGDVMVFRYPVQPEINYIKRVVGLPGDRIEYTRDKQLLINGQPVAKSLIGSEPGTLGSVQLYTEKLGAAEHRVRELANRGFSARRYEWVVPEGHYFMMGDNRDESLDSRLWDDPKQPDELQGMVPEKYIVGKAFAIWMSWPSPKLSNLPGFSRVGSIQ